MVNSNLFAVLAENIGIDRGTETDIMSTMHCFLHAKHGDLEDATECIVWSFNPKQNCKVVEGTS